jgi:hypothetical protein
LASMMGLMESAAGSAGHSQGTRRESTPPRSHQ